MHHLYPTTNKGDSLCPLGFHPQVRWPTRCKRCFRDYKEHCGKRREEDDSGLRRDAVTASTPSLSQSSTLNDQCRNWVSSDNLHDAKPETELSEYKSTLDLVHLEDYNTTINFTLPRRKKNSTSSEEHSASDRSSKHESINEKSNSIESAKTSEPNKRIQIKEVKTISNGPTSNDVQFLIQVKKKPSKTENNTQSQEVKQGLSVPSAADSTLRKRLNEVTEDLENLKIKCDQLEKEKREIILRRLPAMEPAKKLAGENQKLQQKCYDLQKDLKQCKEEKNNLQVKIRKLEDDLKSSFKDSSSTVIDEVKSKLRAAETLCEELMDENEALKKDIREMEEQIDEMQDNFREDQVAEYSSLKAELEQTTKNCRILSFKLRKAEKKSEQLEIEKKDFEKKIKEISDKQVNTSNIEKIKRLEQELANSTDMSSKLQNELGELNKKIFELEASSKAINDVKKSSDKKPTSNKISRQLLIRSGSQEEPVHLPDTSEIEKDLREQLKFSEEEVENLRKMILRLEGDNELLLLQLKKIATQIRNKSGNPSDFIDDEELKLQLELTEQEITPHKEKNDFEKNTRLQLSKSNKSSESDKTNTKIVEYEIQVKELSSQIEDERTKNKQKLLDLNKSLKKWENESKKLKTQIENLEETNKSMNESLKNKENIVNKLERRLTTEKSNLKLQYTTEIEKLQNDITALNQNLSDVQVKLNKTRDQEKDLKEKLKESEAQKESLNKTQENKISSLEISIKEEQKKYENYKKEIEPKLSELKLLKNQMLNKSSETKHQTKIKELTEAHKKTAAQLNEEKLKHKEVQAKYEDLEEELALAKAKIEAEKESMNNDLQNAKSEIEKLSLQIKNLESAQKKNADAWQKEKAQLLAKNKRPDQSNGESNDLDKMRYNSILGEKQSELEKYKKENESMNYQIEYMRKETDEMRRKLDDYQKVNKVQRNISADSSAMEREIRDLNNRLVNVEKVKKTDLLKCKMRYEEQLSFVNNEIKTLQNQIMRFKKERDTYKNMLQSAQKSIGDLKHRHKDPSGNDLQEESLNILESQINALEDELSETKLDYSKIKTQLVSDKSSYEVKILELQTRVNELEEEKILSSGRTKIAGLRTRMELSWQKEREEQQRVLQETATLARDLRQTLFEVEKEKDKERLESKRKFDQMKKSSEEEQTESKRKIKDLQCDLLELRDAHAKLRTTNERLKRDRERLKTNEEMLRQRSLSRTSLVSDNKDLVFSRHIDHLKHLSAEIKNLQDQEKVITSRSNNTQHIRARSLTPSFEDKKEKLESVISNLLHITEDLKDNLRQTPEDETSNSLSARSRGSSEMLSTMYRGKINNHQASLKRRSLSLEHTIPKEQSIWQGDNQSISSLRSVGSDLEMWAHENGSVDSRLSDSSTQSDMTTEKKKKKKGLLGKLKKMTKSRSIDDQDSGIISGFLTPKKNSLENIHDSKKDLKEKITGIFKRGGSSSRSNSMERQKSTEVKHDTSSRQRPLMRSESPKGNLR